MCSRLLRLQVMAPCLCASTLLTLLWPCLGMGVCCCGLAWAIQEIDPEMSVKPLVSLLLLARVWLGKEDPLLLLLASRCSGMGGPV